MLIVENIEQLLKDFFALHHPRQVKKVADIAKEFKGKEIELLKAICAKYKKDYSVFPGLEDALSTPAPAPVVEEPVAQLEEAEEEVIEEPVEETQEADNEEESEEKTEA
jgi:hypothetical protein